LNPTARIDKSWRRNATLAWVKLHFEISKIRQVAQEDEELCSRVAAVLKYLQEFGHANTAYNDLRRFIEQLTSEESTQLLSILKTNTIFRRPDKVTDDATIAQDGDYPTDQDVS
jgi:N-terminal acetyltransferase B complex non-catalytic subunit